MTGFMVVELTLTDPAGAVQGMRIAVAQARLIPDLQAKRCAYWDWMARWHPAITVQQGDTTTVEYYGPFRKGNG